MGLADGVGPKRPESGSLRSLLVVLLFVGLLMGIQAVSAYYLMFSSFPPQDDEGHVMAPIDRVRRGGVLGNEVYSNFGPAYTLTYAWFFRLTRLDVTHDAIRLITVGLWLLVAWVCWFICYRITRRTAVSLLVCYAAFQCALMPFISEPGHPQEIITLGLVLVPAAAAALLPGRKGWFSFLAGMLVGYVLMCKVNVGLFGLGGLALAMVAATGGSLARVVKWLLVVAAVSAPTFFIFRHLDTAAGSHLTAVATLAFAATLAQVMVRKANDFALSDWGWAALGCLAMVAAACGVALLSGTSVAALQQIVLLNSLQHVEVHFTTWTLTKITLVLSLLSCAASLIVAYAAGSGKWRRVSLALQWMVRVLLVAGMIWHFKAFGYIGLDLRSQFSIYGLVLPLLWIGLVPVVDQIGFRERVVRNLSGLIAVFHGLVVYPVSGTQVALACVLFMPVWGFALHDTLVGLAAILPARGRRLVLGRIAAALVAVALLVEGGYRVASVSHEYAGGMPLALPGSTLLRIDWPDAAIFRFLAANLRQPGRTFLTMPGMYSLYFWAEKAPPTGLNAADWMVMLSDRQQQQVVESVRSHKDLWAVVSPAKALSLVGTQRVEDKPLVKFILSECPRVNSVGGIELGQHAGESSRKLVQCVHWGVFNGKQSPAPQDAMQLICRMPIALSHVAGPIARKYVCSSGAKRTLQVTADACPLAALLVVDVLTQRVVASSRANADRADALALLIPGETPFEAPTVMPFPPLDLPEGCEVCFTMRIRTSPANDAPAGAIRRDRNGFWVNDRLLAANLLGPNGELLDSIPFLTNADLSEVPRPRPLRLWQAPPENQ